jgi:hypothetical protein
MGAATTVRARTGSADGRLRTASCQHWHGVWAPSKRPVPALVQALGAVLLPRASGKTRGFCSRHPGINSRATFVRPTDEEAARRALVAKRRTRIAREFIPATQCGEALRNTTS